MTEETTQTFDVYGEPDYSSILEDIRSEAQYQTELLQSIHELESTRTEYLQTYLPEFFKVSWLILGSFIAVTTIQLNSKEVNTYGKYASSL